MENKRAVIACKRWKLLKEALKSGRVDASADESVRNFQGFGLFSLVKCSVEDQEDDGEWFEYSSPTFESFRVNIRHCSNTVTLNHLSGFNNTGNVGIWPAEEVLTYYCLKHKDMFIGKAVCELGGGMTCLAGMAVWSNCTDSIVTVSDGNDRSIQNLQMIVSRNSSTVDNKKIAVRNICWGSSYSEQSNDMLEMFDYVLCADCLFFKETVASLVNLIYNILKSKGIAFITAPSRNGTFQNFYNIVKEKFKAEILDHYDDFIEELHQNVNLLLWQNFVLFYQGSNVRSFAKFVNHFSKDFVFQN